MDGTLNIKYNNINNIKKVKDGEVQLWRKYHATTNGGFKGCQKKYGLDWRTLKGLMDKLEKAGYDWQLFDIESMCDISLSKGEIIDSIQKQLIRCGVPSSVFEDENEYIRKYEYMMKDMEG